MTATTYDAPMSDVLTNPRIRELLAEVSEAEALHRDLEGRDADPSEVTEALGDLYSDLGRAFFQWASSPLAAGDMVPETDGHTEGFTNEVPDPEAEARGGGWYAEDVDVDTRSGFFDPGDLSRDDVTEVPEADPATPDGAPERSVWSGDYADNSDDGDDQRQSLAAMVLSTSDPSSTLAALRRGEEPTWKHHLDELLELLELPEDFADAEAISVETTRVQWAANQLETRLTGIPTQVQVCMLGMLAARAQHLRTRLDIDVGPRLSLDRLQRYRLSGDLPTVAGLLATPRPETDGWSDDVRAWWALLRP